MTDTTSELRQELSWEQFDAAVSLAGALGHEWACSPHLATVADALRDGGSLMTVGLIRALTVVARGTSPFAGIEVPTVYGDTVVHSTLTGRVTYRIEWGGRTLIHVSRPAGRVLEVTIDDDACVIEIVGDGETALCRRHVEAAQNLVHNLGFTNPRLWDEVLVVAERNDPTPPVEQEQAAV